MNEVGTVEEQNETRLTHLFRSSCRGYAYPLHAWQRRISQATIWKNRLFTIFNLHQQASFVVTHKCLVFLVQMYIPHQLRPISSSPDAPSSKTTACEIGGLCFYLIYIKHSQASRQSRRELRKLLLYSQHLASVL